MASWLIICFESKNAKRAASPCRAFGVYKDSDFQQQFRATKNVLTQNRKWGVGIQNCFFLSIAGTQL